MKAFTSAIFAFIFLLNSPVQAADFENEISGYLYENPNITFSEYYATSGTLYQSAPSIIGYVEIGSRMALSALAISYNTSNMPSSPCASGTLNARKYLADHVARDVILGVIAIENAPFVARYLCNVAQGAPIDAEVYFLQPDGTYIASAPVTINP